MDRSYDVVVIGAGPAGCQAAMEAARDGAKTLLLEKHSEVGRPVCCAGGISVAGLERVVRPEEEWISSRINRATVVAPSGSAITVAYQQAGYILHRDKFDSGLSRRAVEAGAELLNPAPVTAVRMKDDSRIDSVWIEHDGSKSEIEAGVFIAADGVESQVAAMAGIETTLGMSSVDSACQYLREGLDIDDDRIVVYLGNDVAPGGYAWAFPGSRTSAFVGLAILPGRPDVDHAREYLDKFVAAHFPEGRRLEIMMGAVPTFQPGFPLLRGNLMIVGDAARLIDSLSGAGISCALLSGSIAGRTAARWLARKGNLSEYPREFMRIKRRELYAYRILRTLFVRSRDADFEQVIRTLRRLFPEGNLDSLNIPELALKSMLKNPRLLWMARYLASR
jgi:digeranylgeranylglycerophospholipid reductase